MSPRKTVIAISGTPGTGKTTLAAFLSKALGFSRIDLHEHYKAVATKYDRKKQCYVVDIRKVAALVRKEKREASRGIIIDSHISHLLPRRLIDLCIVLTCSDLKVLEKRLKKRKYSRKKIRENLDAEIFQVCWLEAQERGQQVIVFDTAKGMKKKEILKRIVKEMEGRSR
ncbi:MAG: adenylate kinase family protein [Nanoarchaeota archaeon]|nr:adenylate kinase family protein [Nanoarchaeota archaeon]